MSGFYIRYDYIRFLEIIYLKNYSSIEFGENEDITEVLRRYLRHPKTSTAWHLSQKPVVIIEPSELRGGLFGRLWDEILKVFTH